MSERMMIMLLGYLGLLKIVLFSREQELPLYLCSSLNGCDFLLALSASSLLII